MTGYKKMIFIANLLAFLLVFNWLIFQKEYTIKNGELVLLELYPRDPRSIMQGDYMELRYIMTNQWGIENIPSRGFCIVKKTENNIAVYDRLQPSKTPIADDEIALKYYSNGYTVKIGAESFMFEEGQQKAYDNARYGGLRVEGNGSAVLVGLYDEKGNKLVNNYTLEH